MNKLNITSKSDSISGLIERVTYHDENSGFSVLQVKVKGHRNLVSVIGHAAGISAGEWIDARGVWKQNRNYGLQFEANELKSSPPSSLDGIAKYLGSGLIKGIGPVYAKKLVARFGKQVLDVIENHSAKLETVEGIGPGRRKKIKVAWNEQKAVRDIMIFLHSHGVGTSKAVKIFKTYGDDSIEVIRKNPFVLAKDIHGIGFMSADKIALQVGIPKESRERVEACINHILLEATQDGHCALPREQLIEKTANMLNVPDNIVTETLTAMNTEQTVSFENIDGAIMVFHPGLSNAESYIAGRILGLINLPPVYPNIDIQKAMEWFQTKTGKALSPSQQEAFTCAFDNRVVILTGGPGVGKTTWVQALITVLSAKKVNCLLCAPTGRAAKRLAEATGHPAKTIHRLLEFQPNRGFTRNEKYPLECNLLVVDEMSMVDILLFHKLLRALPPDAHLVMVGDADQLPSVGPGSLLKDLIDSKRVPCFRLSQIFRQAAGSHIIVNSHRINNGQMPELPENGVTSDFYFIERKEPEAILNTVIKVVSERIPQRFGLDPTADIQVLTPMNRGILGTRTLNETLRNSLNPETSPESSIHRYGWAFRINDKVIQTENNYNKDVFNGDIGIIRDIDNTEQTVYIKFESGIVEYEFSDLDQVLPAYAITIHKSQGSEFPAVVIPIDTSHYVMLQRNLIYTAVTRGKQLVVLIGKPSAMAIAVRNAKTQKRFTALINRMHGSINS
ncbi:MAG: ATP-dependent RecD-like DNA helicase [Verrucomicrobia bacterium]|nr:ATP-dependent RecD-like DNA helicase [Verrucomicrobiota bacterium]MCF7709221.1 ATP-dependent RecD-like DNA helicase [Verrucomicrobiota bacterium]